jgi:type IV pilus assembly protein PilN
MLISSAIIGVGVWGLGHMHYTGLIEHQNRRNSILEKEIKELDAKIIKIKELEETKQKLIARMNVIQELQQGRPFVVHLFDQLVTTLPDGVYLVSAKQAGGNLTLTGGAESNARISTYMENLDGSEWLDDPRLDVIQVKGADTQRISEYTLRVKLTNTGASGQADSGKKQSDSNKNNKGQKGSKKGKA